MSVGSVKIQGKITIFFVYYLVFNLFFEFLLQKFITSNKQKKYAVLMCIFVPY